MSGPERAKVELPLLEQLEGMGWRVVDGNLDHPSVSGRTSFREVLLGGDLEAALRRINLDEQGQEWLDLGRIATAVSALERHGKVKLMEANQAVHERLLAGVSVEGVDGWDGGRLRTVHYIDWEHPERNTFVAVSQFKLAEPGGQAHQHIIPDIVLFVNGIPLVVIECKSPNKSEPIADAIDQIQRYANQRKREGRVEQDEGNERLFWYNAFNIATSFDEARVATIDASSVHYLAWKDTSPTPMAAVAAALSRERLSSQQCLVAGMLRPEHLLDLVRHFVVFEVEGGRTVKKVARYQQFRAVHSTIEGLKTGETKAVDGEHDRRGGIIWHTQGSGKSLSMVFLVRKMRTDPTLRRFKVVVVTDRRDLQKQLSDTASLSGDVVQIARNSVMLRGLLEAKGPALVFATIQKYLERDDDGVAKPPEDDPSFPVLNEDESILVVVDEAHRSHGSVLHANLLRALPNAARVGFTGTPIIMGAKKKTHEIFGDFIDRYTIQQSEEDGSTLPILYEGRTASGAVADGRDLDEVFEDMFRDWSQPELDALKARYATKGNVVEAEKLIQAKAKDMLRHYIDNILPNGFKAQVVAVSRRATVRYHQGLLAARDDLVAEIERLSPATVNASEAEVSRLPAKTQMLLRARQHLDRIKALEFAPVFSGAHNDPGDWSEWTEESKVAKRIADFKKPFEHRDADKRSNLAFVIVKSMLITGWDAPIAQVQYIDRGIQEAELLQAIARVNRTYTGKKAGIVVDYYGVARHLKKALAAYSDEDVQGALKSLADEIPTLRDQHLRVVSVFTDRDVELVHTDDCVELLEDGRLRAEFTVKLKAFLSTLDTVLPRPEALPYISDARRLGEIALRARNRYRDDTLRPLGKDVGEKVRELIDQHVISLGIDPKVPPMSILDAKFEEQVKAGRSPRARASEMEHALRYHIRKHLEEDPEHWEKLSQRLDAILNELKEKWEEIEQALSKLVEDARAGRREAVPGLDAEIHAPFFGVLRQTIAQKPEMDEAQQRRLAGVVVEMVEHIRQEVALVGFWGNLHAQELLRRWVIRHLDDANVMPFEKLAPAADRVMEVAKANHGKLIR